MVTLEPDILPGDLVSNSMHHNFIGLVLQVHMNDLNRVSFVRVMWIDDLAGSVWIQSMSDSFGLPKLAVRSRP